MRESQLYKQFKQTVLDSNYTVAQVCDAEKQQVTDLLGSEISDEFFENMKSCLVGELQGQVDENALQGVKNQLAGGGRKRLETNFPAAEFELAKEFDKRVIKVWLEGRPETEEL